MWGACCQLHHALKKNGTAMRLCFGLFQDREGSDWKRRNEPSRSHGRVLLLWGRICVSKNKWSRVVVGYYH